jgi:glutamate synthase (NADPH/NADH) large chain
LREERINRDALATGELELTDVGSGDREIIRDLLKEHLAATGSPQAKRLLDNEEENFAQFTKITPRDYRAVLGTREQALKEGLDPDGDVVWGRILEVTGG